MLLRLNGNSDLCTGSRYGCLSKAQSSAWKAVKKIVAKEQL
jgi:hypothetical protein